VETYAYVSRPEWGGGTLLKVLSSKTMRDIVYDIQVRTIDGETEAVVRDARAWS
jgi:hypothetical protein